MTGPDPLFEEIERLLEEYAHEANVVGPKDDASIERAEKHLGVQFPPSYREFLKRWGALGFGPEEFYGITTDNFESATVPNGVWFTAKKHQESGLPKSLVVVVNENGDQYLAIDTSHPDAAGEAPVVIWDVPSAEVVGTKADTFARFLLERLRETIEIMKSDG